MYDHPITQKLLKNTDQSLESFSTDSKVENPISVSLGSNEVIQYASFSNRFWAYIVDGINFVPIAALLVFLSSFNPKTDTQGLFSIYHITSVAFGLRLFWIPILQSLKKQASWGQRNQDIFICTRSGHRVGFLLAFLRYSIRAICMVTIVGFLMVLWDKKKRALHDIICGTEVRCRPRAKSNIDQKLPDSPQPSIELQKESSTTEVIPQRIQPISDQSYLNKEEQVIADIQTEEIIQIPEVSYVQNPTSKIVKIMKSYRKFLGIFSFACILATLIFAFVSAIIGDIDWWIFFVLLIPIYLVIHFIILHKFGFSSISEKKQPFYFISSIISIITLIIIPLAVYITSNNEKKQAHLESEQSKKQKELAYYSRTSKLAEPRDLGKFITVYNLKCSLKIRLTDGRLDYIFNADYLKTDNTKISSFTITFFEKNGFEVGDIIISNYTRIWDSDHKLLTGYRAYGSNDWYGTDKYEQIKSYQVSVTSSNLP